MKSKKKKKARARVVSRYEVNPYALQTQTQTRNATGGPPPELVPVVVQPRRRGRVARAKQRAKERLGSKEFLLETAASAVSGGVAALGTGYLAGKGWNPFAVGAATAVLGGIGAAVLPGSWNGVGQGMVAWGTGQIAAAAMQRHAVAQYKKQQEAQAKAQQAIDEQKKRQQLDGTTEPPKELPAPKPANAFLPAISDAFAASRYGRYGRADDEERMTDVDLELG